MYELPADTALETKVYFVGEGDLGPVTRNNGTEANIALLQNLVSATLSIRLVSLNVGVLGAVPYSWRVSAVFDFVTGGGAALFKVRS